jgi:hypothetical protein
MGSDSLVRILDRHDVRRASGVPTVSVFSGPVGLAVRRWRSWAGGKGVAAVMIPAAHNADIITVWLERLSASRDLVADAIRWLERTANLAGDGIVSRLTATTPHDFAVFWATLPLDPARPSSALCRQVLAARVAGERVGVKARDAGAFVALCEIVPAGELPALLVTATELAAATELSAELVRLAIAAPALPLGLALPPAVADELLGPDSRVLAVLREGLIPVESLSAEELARRAGEATHRLAPDLMPRLAAAGAGPELADALAAAAQAAYHPPATSELEDAARSAAERLLLELLETMPETAGLFALNVPLEFRHGRKAAEADLFAERVSLVIELDGAYYHLSDREAYRRDRRKDWEYQRRGYAVLRFLSEDVFPRMEEITATIKAAVAERQSAAPLHPRPPA